MECDVELVPAPAGSGRGASARRNIDLGAIDSFDALHVTLADLVGAAPIPSIAAKGLCAGAGAGGTVHGMWNDGAAGCDATLGLFDIDAPASVSPGASRRACTNAARDANVAHGSAPKTAGAPVASTYAILSLIHI